MRIVKGVGLGRALAVGIAVVLVAVGFVGEPADAGISIDPTGLVDEVAVSLDGGQARSGDAVGPAGRLVSGDIHVTDADLDTEAMSIQGAGVVDGAAGPVTVGFDLHRVLGISPFWNGTVKIETPAERLVGQMTFGSVTRDGDTYAGVATARRDRDQITMHWTVTDQRRGPGNHAEVVSFGGQDRRYFVRMPADYTGETPLPVVVFNHGAGSPWGWFMDVVMGLRQFGDDAGFIVVMPEGKNLIWQFWPGRQVDDLGFMDLILDEVQADYAVDSSRIYMMGHSNGGMLTHQYACDRPGRIAAFGSVGGPLVDPGTCPESRSGPAPFLIMQGTSDPLVPWDGWFGAISTPAAADHWRHKNGCAPAAAVSTVPDRDDGDGSTVRVHDYDCPAGTDVVVHQVIGGGHQWFGGSDILPANLLGNNNRDQLANQVFWDFFSRFRL